MARRATDEWVQLQKEGEDEQNSEEEDAPCSRAWQCSPSNVRPCSSRWRMQAEQGGQRDASICPVENFFAIDLVLLHCMHH
jgi:hypothetical protein